ncbi:mandelate racemase/muconate lactonizing enzyme family protein [Desulfoferula mesophila]|uniref:Enolase n=1 Tax=Desulfoferula mesophila TaxID=3058419 RepID=A0AAU9EKR8_9BACT|nr:enolase [Desulfoferula mesophilus]
MKISKVNAYALSLPLVADKLPLPTLKAITPVIVEVATEEGMVGYGEAYGFSCAPVVAKAVENLLQPVLLGRDPTQIQKIWQDLYRVTFNYGRMGIVIAAMAGVEIALWDLAGKASGTPVYQMLGGRAHQRLQAYASPLRYGDSATAVEACQAMKLMGFTAMKPHEIELDTVARIRAAVGEDVDIMLDVNGPWSVREAVYMGRHLEELNLYWLEEPVWPGDDYQGLAEVRASIDIPLAAGENEYTARGFMGLIDNQAVDILQPSVFKIGGLWQAKQVFTLGRTFGFQVAPHCWSLGPAMAASLQLCFSEQDCQWVETCMETPVESPLLEPLHPREGWWYLEDKPGLGIEINKDTIAKYLLADQEVKPSFWLD